MSFIQVGSGSIVETSKVIAIADYSQASIQELVEQADSSRITDLAKGQEVDSVIITNDNRLILCPRTPEVIANSIAC